MLSCRGWDSSACPLTYYYKQWEHESRSYVMHFKCRNGITPNVDWTRVRKSVIPLQCSKFKTHSFLCFHMTKPLNAFWILQRYHTYFRTSVQLFCTIIHLLFLNVNQIKSLRKQRMSELLNRFYFWSFENITKCLSFNLQFIHVTAVLVRIECDLQDSSSSVTLI